MKKLAPLLLILCVVSHPQTGQTQAPVPSNIVQSSPHKFDVRSKGAACNGRIINSAWSGTDDTAAFTAAIQSVSGSEIDIPPASAYGSTCSVAPGSVVIPSVHNSWVMSGSGYELSTIQDDSVRPTGVLRPVVQVGNDPNRLMNSTILRDFSIFGAYGGTPSYPDGILSLFPNNLSQIDNLWVQMPAGTHNSSGIKVVSGTAGFGEMKFDRISVFCPNAGKPGEDNTGINISAHLANTDFIDSNVESCQTGLSFSGKSGTPIVNWRGGHFERISNEGWGGISFKIQQASLHAYGVDMESGMTWLDSSSVGSEISYGGSSKGWPTLYSDSGIGNRYSAISGSPVFGVNLSLTGAEQYETPNQVSDGQFNTCCNEWKASSPAVRAAQYAFNAPGSTMGQSMQVVSSSSASDYVSTTVNVTPGAEYELLALVYFNGQSAPSPTITVVDGSSGAKIYGPVTITPTMATPTGGDAWAYALLRAWIPASRGSSWRIQLSPNTANAHQMLVVPYLAVNPSRVVMGAGRATERGGGSASCTQAGSSSYATAVCKISGSNNGASAAGISWTLPQPARPSGAFLRMHVATDSNSVLPACSVNGTLKLIFAPNSSMDYNFPLPFDPTSISCGDYLSTSSADPNVMVISQLSVVPW